MSDWSSKKILSDVYRAYQVDGWEFIEIWGKKSWGKTTLALLILGDFFHWDWDTAFRHLVFTLEQFTLKMVEANRTGKRIPVLVWDDMAVYMGKYRWTDEAVQEFSEFFVAVRTYLNALISTSPKPGLLVKGIREDYTKKVEITKPIWTGRGEFYYQNLVWYDDYYGPKVKERKHLKEYGQFWPLPKAVYQRYRRLREVNLGEVKLDRLMDALAKRAIPQVADDDVKVLEYIAKRGSLSVRQFQGDGKWAPFRTNLDTLEVYGILERHGSNIVLSSLGEQVWRSREEAVEKTLLRALKRASDEP